MDESYSEPVGETWKYDPDYHRVSDYLGVDAFDRQDVKLAQKVSTLRDWASQHSKSESIEDNVAALNDLRHKVGSNNLGKTLIDELYQHLRFQSKPDVGKNSVKKAPTASQHKAKSDPISKVVQKSVEARIAEIVNKTMSNKNVMYKAIDQVTRNIIK